MLSHGLLQGLNDLSSIGAFQRNCTHDLAGEVVNSHQDLNGPQAPAQDLRSVNRPDMIGMRGRDRARFCLLLQFLRRDRSCGHTSRFRPLQDVSHGRGRRPARRQGRKCLWLHKIGGHPEWSHRRLAGTGCSYWCLTGAISPADSTKRCSFLVKFA